MPDSSDSKLVQQLTTGSESAARTLYDRYVRRLFGFAKGKLGHGVERLVEPEDIVQSTFRTFFRRAADGSYEVSDEGGLWSLLRTIANHKASHQGRHHRAQKRDVGRVVEAPTPLANCVVTQENAGDLKILLDELLEQLPERERSIVRYRIEGHRVADIAELAGCSKRTTERVLEQFRVLLGTQMQNGVSESEA